MHIALINLLSTLTPKQLENLLEDGGYSMGDCEEITEITKRRYFAKNDSMCIEFSYEDAGMHMIARVFIDSDLNVEF